MHEVTTGGGDIPHLTSDGLGRPSDASRGALRLLSMLVDAALREAGGVTLDSASQALRAAMVLPASRSTVDRIRRGEMAPTAAQVAVLLEHAGIEAVAGAACRLAGGRYERVLAADVSISGGVLHVVSELGVISAAVADGHVDDQEAAHITVACDRAIEALAAVRSQAAGRVRGAA